MKYTAVLSLAAIATLAYADIKVDDVEATYTFAAKVKAAKELRQHIDIGFANTTGNTETLNLNAAYGLAFTTTGITGTI